MNKEQTEKIELSILDIRKLILKYREKRYKDTNVSVFDEILIDLENIIFKNSDNDYTKMTDKNLNIFNDSHVSFKIETIIENIQFDFKDLLHELNPKYLPIIKTIVKWALIKYAEDEAYHEHCKTLF